MFLTESGVARDERKNIVGLEMTRSRVRNPISTEVSHLMCGCRRPGSVGQEVLP